MKTLKGKSCCCIIMLGIILGLSDSIFSQDKQEPITTKFTNIKPRQLKKDEYSKELIKGLKIYRVQLFDDLRYMALVSFLGGVRIEFPYKVVDCYTGASDYFKIKKDLYSVYITVQMPANAPDELRRNPDRLVGKLSAPLHITFENKKAVLINIEIATQEDENEKIVIFDPETEAEDGHKDVGFYERAIEKKNAEILECLKRERRLQFDEFALDNINAVKKYEHSQITLKSITGSKDYYYYNLEITGGDLSPIKKDDFTLKAETYTNSIIWEQKNPERTYKPEYLVNYPSEYDDTVPKVSEEGIPKSSVDDLESKQITLAFRVIEQAPVFYSKLYIKNELIVFENKVNLNKNKLSYYNFMTDQVRY